jgi:hypothetical protein
MRVVLEETLTTLISWLWSARALAARAYANEQCGKQAPYPAVSLSCLGPLSAAGQLMVCQEGGYDIYGPSLGARLFRKVLRIRLLTYIRPFSGPLNALALMESARLRLIR